MRGFGPKELNNCAIYFKYVNIISILLQAGARGSCIEWRSTVRVLLRHSVVVASPKRIVINHTQLFTIRFGTSVPKSKSGSYISLFVWNFRSQIEERKLICHNLFWNKLKNRALFVLELALQIQERMLKQKLDPQFDTELGLEVEKTVTSP